MDNNESVSFNSIIIFILLALIWGSSFILIKKAIVAFDPYEVAALRIGISFLAFIPFILKYYKEIFTKNFFLFLIVGLTGSGIPAFMYPIGQTEISSSIAGILNSTTPIFTFFLGILLFQSSFYALKFIGILIGLLGTSILILYGTDYSIGGNPWFSFFILAGTLCYGTNINIVKHYFQNTNPIKLSALSFALIGPPAILFLLIHGTITDIQWSDELINSFLAVLVLAIFGTVVSTVFFFKLVQKNNAVFASSVAYAIPIVALVWGYLDGEIITWIHFAGMALILLGVYLIKRG